MATKLPNSGKGSNNYGAQSPIKNVGRPQEGNGGDIKTTRIAAAATYAGHKQVNPGSSKSDISGRPRGAAQPATKHGAQSTILGKKETSNC